MEDIIRIVDNPARKIIFANVKGKGRVVLAEGDDYPKNGLVGMSVKGFKALLAEKTK